MFSYRFLPRTTTVDVLFAQRNWSHQVPLRTNMNDYRRKNGNGKSEDPKYHDIDDMNIYENVARLLPLPKAVD